MTILCLLDTVDVVRARLVCRRWASVALEPAVWHKRTLDDGKHTVSGVGRRGPEGFLTRVFFRTVLMYSFVFFQ